MSASSRHPRTPPVPAPFLFRGHCALIGELDIDGSLRSRPATEADAKALGSLYPRSYDPRNPFASVERALAGYDGTTDRYIFLIVRPRNSQEPIFVAQDQNGYKAIIEYRGLLEYFIQSVITFLERGGVPRNLITANLFPQPGSPDEKNAPVGRWVIGYECSTGYVTVLDCSQKYAPAANFLRGSNEDLPLDLASLRTGK